MIAAVTSGHIGFDWSTRSTLSSPGVGEGPDGLGDHRAVEAVGIDPVVGEHEGGHPVGCEEHGGPAGTGHERHLEVAPIRGTVRQNDIW